MNDLKGAKFWLNLFLAVTDVKKGGNRVDILINSDRIKECKGEYMSVNAVRCRYQKIERDRSETDKTRAKTK
jgi:hypothetical protein